MSLERQVENMKLLVGTDNFNNYYNTPTNYTIY